MIVCWLTCLVNLSPNSLASPRWISVQLKTLRFQDLGLRTKFKNKIFNRALSLVKAPLFLVTLRMCRCSPSTALVV